MQAEQFKHRMLVVVTGMSPQVLTETLYALARREPAFVPDEVHLISTTSGARHARLSLLEGDAHFERLCADYGLDPTIFPAANIHVITDAAGNGLEDIRSPADNEAAADFITSFIRDCTAREDTAVHVSMAGGRKTMGYYAGYALSLYGRAQDRLSHVLVSEGFEGLRGFYYPTPTSRPVYVDGKPTLDAAEAKVELASIPFVRLRDELPEKQRERSALLGGRQAFSAAVAAAQWAQQPHVITLNLPELRFDVDGEPLDGLGDANLSLLCWLAVRQASGKTNLRMLEDIARNGHATGRNYAQLCTYLDQRSQSLRRAGRDAQGSHAFAELPKVIDALAAKGFESRTEFDSRRSRLNKGLESLLGVRAAEYFCLRNFGLRGEANYAFADFDERFRVTPPPGDW